MSAAMSQSPDPAVGAIRSNQPPRHIGPARRDQTNTVCKLLHALQCRDGLEPGTGRLRLGTTQQVQFRSMGHQGNILLSIQCRAPTPRPGHVEHLVAFAHHRINTEPVAIKSLDGDAPGAGLEHLVWSAIQQHHRKPRGSQILCRSAACLACADHNYVYLLLCCHTTVPTGRFLIANTPCALAH